MTRKEKTRRIMIGAAAACALAFLGLLIRIIFTPLSPDIPEQRLKLLADANPVLVPVPPDIGLVIMNNLFVPSREGTEHNSFKELVVKGVIVFGNRKKVILSTTRDLKKDILVEMGEEAELPKLAKNTQDPLFQIYQFFRNWKIVDITPDYMKVRHLRTDKTETYPVNFQPAEHRRSSPRTKGGGSSRNKSNSKKK